MHPARALGSREVVRRTWDTEAFERRAQERARAEKEALRKGSEQGKGPARRQHVDGDPFAPTRGWLEHRQERTNFDEKVGTAEIVTSARGGGFFCRVCNSVLKDSNRYLSHVNSRAHQKALGLSMRVKRSTKEDVKKAFELAAMKLDYVNSAGVFASDGKDKDDKDKDDKDKDDKDKDGEAQNDEFTNGSNVKRNEKDKSSSPDKKLDADEKRKSARRNEHKCSIGKDSSDRERSNRELCHYQDDNDDAEDAGLVAV